MRKQSSFVPPRMQEISAAHGGNATLPPQPHQSDGPTVRPDLDQFTRKMKSLSERIAARQKGDAVREIIRVKHRGDGIIQTRISNDGSGPDFLEGNAKLIHDSMESKASYNRLTVLHGAALGSVVEHEDKSVVEHEDKKVSVSEPVAQAERLPPGTAFVNGGFFATNDLQDEKGAVVPNGMPVGPTAKRWISNALPENSEEGSRYTPIPKAYASTYASLRINDTTGVSSGPLLAHDGANAIIPENDDYKYKVLNAEGKTEYNPKSRLAGALTHSGDRNARSAISLTKTGHAVLHTLTADNQASGQDAGATVAKWQDITRWGAQVRHPSKQIKVDAKTPLVNLGDVAASTLNLDGGGSVFMGIRGKQGVKKISGTERKLANIVAVRSSESDTQDTDRVAFGKLGLSKTETK